MHPLTTYLVASLRRQFESHSGRRAFMLRTLIADPKTLPAGKTRWGREEARDSLFTIGLDSKLFARQSKEGFVSSARAIVRTMGKHY